jgi:hypothetical protein
MLAEWLLVIAGFLVAVEVAASDEACDGTDAEFPGVEAGGLDGDLLVVGVGLGADADGGDAGGEGDGEEAGEDGVKVGFHGVFPVIC